MRSASLLFGCMAITGIVAIPGEGRPIEEWPYERLFNESNLVVIATADATADTSDRFREKGARLDFIGQNTEFAVQSVLKGKLAPERKLVMLHYRLPDEVSIVINGPLHVNFRTQGMSLEGKINGVALKADLGKPDYMLFLRRRPDGRYEPVSGEVDPALSIRELYRPDRLFSMFGGR